jgi:hypothetical protein
MMLLLLIIKLSLLSSLSSKTGYQKLNLIREKSKFERSLYRASKNWKSRPMVLGRPLPPKGTVADRRTGDKFQRTISTPFGI